MSIGKPRIDARTTWVVEACSGIRAALAPELEERSARVAISALRHDSLDAVASGRMTVVAADVTDCAGLDAVAEPVRRRTRRDRHGHLQRRVLAANGGGRLNRDVFATHVEINLLGLNNFCGAVATAHGAASAGSRRNDDPPTARRNGSVSTSSPTNADRNGVQ